MLELGLGVEDLLTQLETDGPALTNVEKVINLPWEIVTIGEGIKKQCKPNDLLLIKMKNLLKVYVVRCIFPIGQQIMVNGPTHPYPIFARGTEIGILSMPS